MEKIRVRFLAASPKVSPLALDQEIREITTKIRAAEHRDSLEVISRWAVRPDDLQQALLEHRPHILHFSGHGTKSEELVLLDGKGEPKPVSKEALVHLLGVLKDNLRLIVLNACFSRPQAEAITQVIDCAVGVNRAVGDEAAIGFAAAFYRAIGFGRSIQTAFDLGRSALMLDDIPEDSTPELVARAGIDPAGIILVQPDRQQHALGLDYSGFDNVLKNVTGDKTMDPLSTITTAIVAAVANLSEPVIKDAYNALKEIVKKHFGGKAEVANALEQLEVRPDSAGRRQTLQEELQAAKVEQNADVLAAAEGLLAKIEAEPDGKQAIQRVQQTITGNKNIVSGIGNIDIRRR